MDGVFVAVGAKLFKFHAPGRIAAIFHGGVSGNPRRAFIQVGTTLSTFQGDYQAHAFVFSHDRSNSKHDGL
jgi:hypothetical protein